MCQGFRYDSVGISTVTLMFPHNPAFVSEARNAEKASKQKQIADEREAAREVAIDPTKA